MRQRKQRKELDKPFYHEQTSTKVNFNPNFDNDCTVFMNSHGSRIKNYIRTKHQINILPQGEKNKKILNATDSELGTDDEDHNKKVQIFNTENQLRKKPSSNTG